MARTHDSLKILRDLYQHVPCGIHSLDRDGTIVEVNETEAGWLGYPRDELLGKKLIDLLTPESQTTFTENFPRFKARGELRDLELDLVRRDGSILPVLVRATAVQDRSDAYVMSRSILYDMTERKRGEETRLRLAAIVDSSDDAIIGENLDRVIQSWNPGAEAMFGYPAQEVVGQSMAVLLPRERQHEFAEIMARIRRGDRLRHYETERLRKDGHRIHVSLTISPIRNAAGTILGAATIARDITEQRRDRLKREQLIIKLQAALAKVKVLSGLLPICAACKKIQDSHGGWHHLESYIRQHSEAEFSHGICPECMRKLYPEVLPEKNRQGQ